MSDYSAKAHSGDVEYAVFVLLDDWRWRYSDEFVSSISNAGLLAAWEAVKDTLDHGMDNEEKYAANIRAALKLIDDIHLPNPALRRFINEAVTSLEEALRECW